MLKGFRDFIMKGNVVDLATAVIIATAFTAIVTAFTDGIIKPIINTIPWSPNEADGLGFELVSGKSSTFVNIGGVLTAVINFLIIAAVIYFLIIVPYNKLAELGGFGKKAEVTEVALLTEIRDLMDPDSVSKAKAEAEKDLPDHLSDSGGGDDGSSGSGASDSPDTYSPSSDAYPSGRLDAAPPTQRLTTPPPASQAPYEAPVRKQVSLCRWSIPEAIGSAQRRRAGTGSPVPALRSCSVVCDERDQPRLKGLPV